MSLHPHPARVLFSPLRQSSGCIFSKNYGETGFVLADSEKNALIEKSFIYGNTFENGPIIQTESYVDISKTLSTLLNDELVMHSISL